MSTPVYRLASTGMSATDTEAASTQDQPEPTAGTAPRSEVSASGPAQKSSLALVATLLSMVALAVAGWATLQLSSLQEISTRMNGNASQRSELARRLDRLDELSERQQQSLTELESSLDNGLSVIPDLSLRLEQAEEQLGDMPGVNARTRADWLKTEALYYLRIANAQAALVGDAQVAASALQLADDKLRDAGDPSMTQVRAQLSTEIAALKALPAIDRAGISFSLQSLARQVDVWPFRSAAPDNFTPDIVVVEEPEMGPWDRFVATFKSVFASIISVKQTDEPRAAQLGSAEQALVVETIKAELQIARLALIGGNSGFFQQTLARATEQIELYFDTEAAAVGAAQATLLELRALELPAVLPDISGSLVLMISLTEDAAGAPADSQGEPGNES
jgi:uroporphyrin-3 C-methyltransferase